MTVKELIEQLKQFEGDLPVMIYDSCYDEVNITSVEEKYFRHPFGDKFIVLID